MLNNLINVKTFKRFQTLKKSSQQTKKSKNSEIPKERTAHSGNVFVSSFITIIPNLSRSLTRALIINIIAMNDIANKNTISANFSNVDITLLPFSTYYSLEISFQRTFFFIKINTV